MTEVHAFSDVRPVEGASDDEPWPTAGNATEAPEGAAHAVTPAPPAPARTGSAGLVADDGTRLAAGLSWEIASGPEKPVLGVNAPLVLRLPTRRAQLADAGTGTSPCGSLLLHMASELTAVHFPAASGPWAFIAEIPAPVGPPALWMGLADIAAPGGPGRAATDEAGLRAVTPRPGPEMTFETPGEALGALEQLLGITEIAGIAVRWLPVQAGMTSEDTHRGQMIAGIAEISETVDLHDVGPAAPAPLGVDRDAALAASPPVFVPPRRLPVRLLAGLGIGVGAMVAGIFVILPMIEEALRPPPPPPPEMVRVHIAPDAFGTACTEALDAWWPRITSWRLDSAGCAMAGHLPENPVLPEPRATDRTSRAMVVWRHLVPKDGRNIVLGRRAAGKVLDEWPHESRLDEASLTLWSTASLPLTPLEGADAEASQSSDPDAIRARLAALWAHTPGAVTLQREGRSAGHVRIVTAAGTPAGASLSRAGEVPGISPVRLVETEDGQGEMLVGPVVSREVPVTLLDFIQGGPSQ